MQISEETVKQVTKGLVGGLCLGFLFLEEGEPGEPLVVSEGCLRPGGHSGGDVSWLWNLRHRTQPQFSHLLRPNPGL